MHAHVQPDKSGRISTEKLRATIKVTACITCCAAHPARVSQAAAAAARAHHATQAFELTLDIDRLIREVELDRGYLEYKDFKAILA